MLAARLVAWLFLPYTLCLLTLAVGCLTLWRGRRPRLGRWLVTAGTALLVAASFGPAADALLRPFEAGHPAYGGPAEGPPARWVVVLGCGYRPDPSVPATARVPGGGVVRLAEGVRAYRANPGSRLLVLIGGADAADGRAEAVGELLTAFGVPPADVVTDATGRSTAEEADVIRQVVGDERFVLVTSASHMPRAVQLCRDRGLDPIPAPTDHAVAGGEYPALNALPSPGNLDRTQRAGSETLGWAARLLGR